LIEELVLSLAPPHEVPGRRPRSGWACPPQIHFLP
jgi:hypothetical protein